MVSTEELLTIDKKTMSMRDALSFLVHLIYQLLLISDSRQ